MEDQVQVHNTISYNDYASDGDHASDCGSSVASPVIGDRIKGSLFDHDLVRLDEDNGLFWDIERKFRSRLGDLADETTVVAIHKNSSKFPAGQARLRAFKVHAQSLVTQRHGAVANNNVVKFAWYGGFKEEIARIMSHGFGHHEICKLNDKYTNGICLSPIYSPVLSVRNCVVDEDGLRHVLLCRVLLGSAGLVNGGSSQLHPSSKEFDSGVDNVASPTRYIIWSTQMGTHILPEYVISFRAPPCLMMEMSRVGHVLKKKHPTSPWMPLPALFSVLSKCVPPRTMNLIKKHHKDFKERKISRRELIQKVRELTRDDLLITIIKSCQAKTEVNSPHQNQDQVHM